MSSEADRFPDQGASTFSVQTKDLDGPMPTQEEFDDAEAASRIFFDAEPTERITLMARAAEEMRAELLRNSDSSLL